MKEEEKEGEDIGKRGRKRKWKKKEKGGGRGRRSKKEIIQGREKKSN